MNKESIQKIADHYGYDAQSRQLIEEMAELTQAINKAWRYGDDFDNLLIRKRNIAEEIADVTIMLEQMKYLLRFSDNYIEEIIEQKVYRQLVRIKREKTEKEKE